MACLNRNGITILSSAAGVIHCFKYYLFHSYGLELNSETSDDGWMMCKTKGSSVGELQADPQSPIYITIKMLPNIHSKIILHFIKCSNGSSLLHN